MDISDGDMKDVRAFFDKYLYVPWPQYSSLCRLWSTLIEKALDGENVPDDFDISTLARVSQGYTAGAIAYAVKNVLTPRRVKMIAYAAAGRVRVPESVVPVPQRLRCPARAVQG